MDLTSILQTDGYHIKNPKYKKGNGEPEYIISQDPTYAPRTTADLFMEATKRGELGSLGEASAYQKYIRGGITPSRVDDIGNYDIILANNQSAGEKWKNALAQTIVNEFLIGTVKSFTDLFDILSGEVFKGDNDYSNPASRYLEQLQEEFKANHEIYTDPNKTLGNGALFDAGWWASNVPSIASTLTLLIPSKAVTSGMKLLAKGVKAGVSTSRKGALALKKLERATGLTKNTEKGTKVRRMFENGVSAVTMRTLENYQEGRQVYDDMYEQASESLNNMSQEEYNKFLQRNASELDNENVDINDRDAVARTLAHNAATKTFITDYINIWSDVIAINALRNPLKFEKNIRRTAAVNKAQRERIAATIKAAGLETEKGTEKSLLRNVGNWFKDRTSAGLVVASELGEGVEEAVNYIAQQEGMHYGRVMLDLENKNDFGDRLGSYLHSSDLYESAFWGVLGGVAFQAGGSGINRISNRIEGGIRGHKEKKKGEKTKEKTNVAWQKKYETSEDKYRTEQMAKPVKDLNLLKERLNSIKNDTDPFNPDKKLTTDEERDEARKRAIDDYVTNMAFSAIDSGTWDLTKDYLRDENVQTVLKKLGVIDETSEDVESIIAKMDKVEQDYNDEIQRVSELTTYFTDMPFEYIQIIARQNTIAKQTIDRLDGKIKDYEVSANKRWDLLKENLDENIDYKRAVQLAVASQRIGHLNALKKEIENDKSARESISGRQQLNQLNKELNIIYDSILGTTPKLKNTEGIETDDTVRQLSELMYIIGHASQVEKDPVSGFRINKNSTEYLDFIDKLGIGDLKGILDSKKVELGKYKFEATDEQLIRVFGDFKNGDYEGSYQVLKDTMDSAFDESNGLQNKTPELFNDYSKLAFLNLAKLENIAEMATTTTSVNLAINRTHNWMNQARAAAIKKSWDVIDTLAKKHGYDVTYNKIFSNANADTLTKEENKNLAEALEVLNLTASHNDVLAEELRRTLLLASVEKAIEEQTSDDETGESSSTSENPELEAQPQPMENSATNGQQANLGGNEEQEQQLSPLGDTNTPKPQKLAISFNSDGRFDATNVPEDKGIFGFKYATQDDGSVVVLATESGNVPKYLLAKTELFKGFNPNNNAKIDITKNPVIAKDDNGNWYVKEKGEISYNYMPDNANKITAEATQKGKTLPTGEIVEAEAQEAVNAEVEFSGKNYFDDSDAQAKLVKDIKPKIKALVESIKGKVTDVEIRAKINQIKEEVRGKYNVEDKTFDGVFNTWTGIAINKLTDKGFFKSSATVLLSSVTDINGRYDFTSTYVKALAKMVEDYAKEYDINKIDGKYYISVEDLLRRINYIYDDKTLAASMYSAMVAYMQSPDGKKEYVITDDSVTDILDNVVKSDEQRLEERIGSKVDYRVAIDKYFEDNTDSFKKAYSSLREGDILKYEVSDGKLLLKKGNTVIGELPYPHRNSETGNYYNVNMGWIEEVWEDDGGNYTSNVAEFYRILMEHKDDISKKLYNNIYKLNYDKSLSDDQKGDLIEESFTFIIQLAENIYGNSEKIVAKNANNRDVVSHLANIVGFFNKPVDNEQLDLYIHKSLNDWFEKLYNTYNDIGSLAENIEKDNVQIRISKMTSGEVIRNFISDEKAPITREGYNAMRLCNDNALSATAEPVVGMIDFEDATKFITTEKTVSAIGAMKNRSSGKVYVVIKKNNRDSKGDYEPENADFVIGAAVYTSDKDLKKNSVAYKVFNNVRKEINYLIDQYAENPNEENFNKLNDFLRTVFYRPSTKDSMGGMTPNTPLLFNVSYVTKNGVVYLNSKEDGSSIGFSRGSVNDLTGTTAVTYFGVKPNEKSHFKPLTNSPADVKEFKKAVNRVFDTARFSIDRNHIKGERTNGLITFNEAGTEVTITIPNSKTGKPYIKTYKVTAKERALGQANPYNKLVLQGGFIRVNTSVENGSNYRHKGSEGRQAANQTLNVTIDVKRTSPVRKNVQITTQPATQAKQSNKFNVRTVFNNGIANVDDILKNSGYSEEQINLLKELNLLPKNIIFAPKLNETKKKDSKGVERWEGDNAEAKVDTGYTFVGNKWIDMYNGEGEFVLNSPVEARKTAMRVLMHEQLHHRLHADPKKLETYRAKIKEIYDEFEEYLKTNNVPETDKIRQYLFKKYGDDTDRIYEEFLVEGLTSKKLSSYLNKITAKENKKLTLLEKLRNFIKQILGLDVNAGSLLEKHIDVIQDMFGENTTSVENTIEEVKKEPAKIVIRKLKKNKDNTDQLELDFDKNAVEESAETAKSETPEKPETKEEVEKPKRSRRLIGGAKKINGDNSFSSEIVDIDSTYTPEMQSIKDKAIADGTFMKAPNGNLTNLTEKQWLLVRTKAFKEWFGDWEWNAYLSYLVETHNWEFVFEDQPNDKLKIGSKVNADNPLNNLCIYTRNKAISHLHSLGFKHVHAIGGLRAKSPVMDKTISHKSAILNIGGKLYLYDMPQTEFITPTNITFGEKNQYKEATITSNFKPRFIELTVDNLVNIYGDNKEHAEWLVNDQYENNYEDNMSYASKVVDENGEPLVVYHGTDAVFEEFDTQAIYLSDSEDTALTYTGIDYNSALDFLNNTVTELKKDPYYTFVPSFYQGTDYDYLLEKLDNFHVGVIHIPDKSFYNVDDFNNIIKDIEQLNYDKSNRNTIHAFANIRKPIIINAAGKTWNDIRHKGKTYSTRQLENEYRNSEHDGIIIKNVKDYGPNQIFREKEHDNIFITYNPNQIKSATDNNGEFSKTDDNIYHSEILDDIPNPTQYPTFDSFVKTSDNPALVLRAANKGEINIQCK